MMKRDEDSRKLTKKITVIKNCKYDSKMNIYFFHVTKFLKITE